MSGRELQTSHSKLKATPINKDILELTDKNRKARPCVNVELAQQYREQQELPPVERGVDPKLQNPPRDVPSPEAEYIEIILDDDLKKDKQKARPPPDNNEGGARPRDYVTGRMLSEFGRSCLRCTEKGLRCTLNYVGRETEIQCAACRRSKTQYCVRFRPPQDDRKAIPFNGPPWKNPNFFAGSPETSPEAQIPRKELEEMLHDFYYGKPGYLMGNYVVERDVCGFELPPFNGSDLPYDDRPENYRAMDWKDVLPDWRHRSLVPLIEEQKVEVEREEKKKELTEARARSLLPPNPNGEEVKEVKKEDAPKKNEKGVIDDENLSLLRVLRRYSPRQMNLVDVLGETW
ncbi:hypothetical protein NUW58_g3456 [Xylaria curta]|uniref:Uncharacterized protein n=1 Tax=Xylaria curta TaxID=42375 RepID=A0ACC1PAV0_9PEZI|nr:hypothetical protein NUW58_g3456 [Xylaria curta]